MQENFYHIREDNGNLIGSWDDRSAFEYPEDLTLDRTIAELYRRSYEAGYLRAIKDANS